MRRATGVLLAGLTLGFPASTDAQTPATGGLTSSRSAAQDSRSAAPRDPTFAVTLLSGYDGDLLGQTGNAVSLAPLAGSYMGLHGSVNRVYRAWRLATTVSGHGAVRYFPSLREFATTDQDLSIETVAQLGRRVTLAGTQAVRSTPQDLVSPAPRFGPRRVDMPGAIAGGSPSTSPPALLLDSGVELSARVTRRSAATIGYAYLRSPADVAGGRRLHSARADYSGNVGRHLGFRFGYARHQAEAWQASSASRPLQDMATELTFNRQLARRRLRLLIGAGPVILTGDSGRQRNVTAHVTVAHTFRRGWEGTVNYARDLQFAEANGEPIFADVMAAGIDGAFGRRVHVQANVAHSSGMLVEGAAAAQRLQTYHGVGRMTLAVGRHLNPFVEYAYYRHRLDEGVGSSAWPRAMRRQRLEAGITVSTAERRRKERR